jgi:hypothetical protein
MEMQINDCRDNRMGAEPGSIPAATCNMVALIAFSRAACR